MGVFFVDIENVGCNKGLRYSEYLCESDILYLFYSETCANAEKGLLDTILNSGCELHCYNLEKAYKDANDCRIMCEVGYYLGVSDNNDVFIVSNDRIFDNVIRFYENHPDENRRRRIQKCPDLITAIINTSDKKGKERRKQLLSMVRNTSIDRAFSRYKVSVEHKERIKNAFMGSEFECLIPDICHLFEEKRQGKDLYLAALKLFGKVNGTDVYRKLKTIAMDLTKVA